MIRTRRQKKVPATVRQMRAMFNEIAKAADERQEARAEKWEAEKAAMAKAAEERQKAWEAEKAAMDKAREARAEKWEAEKAAMDKAADERSAKLDEQIKAVSTNMGGLNNSFGSFAEEFFGSSLGEKMMFAGQHFDDVIFNAKGQIKEIKDEFDTVYTNSTSVALIEVKTKVTRSQVEEMITKKLPNFRILFPFYKDYTFYLGIGSLTFQKDALDKAHELGIGILRQKGDCIEADYSHVRTY